MRLRPSASEAPLARLDWESGRAVVFLAGVKTRDLHSTQLSAGVICCNA